MDPSWEKGSALDGFFACSEFCKMDLTPDWSSFYHRISLIANIIQSILPGCLFRHKWRTMIFQKQHSCCPNASSSFPSPHLDWSLWCPSPVFTSVSAGLATEALTCSAQRRASRDTCFKYPLHDDANPSTPQKTSIRTKGLRRPTTELSLNLDFFRGWFFTDEQPWHINHGEHFWNLFSKHPTSKSNYWWTKHVWIDHCGACSSISAQQLRCTRMCTYR